MSRPSRGRCAGSPDRTKGLALPVACDRLAAEPSLDNDNDEEWLR